jgi:Bacterial Ig-like domain
MDRLHGTRLDAPAPWLLAVALVLALVPASAAAAGEAPSHRPNRRVCPGPVVGAAGCHSRVITDRNAEPLASSSPSGYGPADFHTAYALPNNAPTAQTIAIVDAYDDPTIESDLAVYSSTYGIPACTTANGCFSKVNQNGVEGSYPKKDAGWALEIALDVEAAHGICQNCEILLVEANSNLFSDLRTAVNTAAALGATQISNSYGGPEFASEASDTAYDHPGIAVTASAGDDGYAAEYPAASPYVVAVGGTTLNLGPSSGYGSETVWSGSGSGCSAYITARSWQTSDSSWALTGCDTKRGVSDVAADANPNTGASVYDTTKVEGQSGWFTVGGTSLSAPLIAGVYALAGGSSSAYPAADPYGHRSDSPASLHDITSGSNGSCGSSTMCKGAVGYDGPTGVGTPKGIAAFGAGGVDATPPQTTIDSGPSGTTNDPTPTFGFSSSESGSTFECRVDAAAFTGCTSPFTSNQLSDGAHVFEVRAKDAATNVDQTPAQRSFTVDTTPPQTTIDSGPEGTTNDSTPTFGFSSEAGASFECRVDAAAFAACNSPQTTPPLSDGAHTYQVRAKDAATNVDQTPAQRSFTVDTTPPQTTIDSGPSGPTNDPTPTFGFSSEPGAGFQCRIDSASFASCTSPYTAAPLSDGLHSFEVRATDGAANVDPSPASRSFTVDTTPPQTTIDSGPEGTTNDPTPTFGFSSEPGAGFQCRIDSASFASCLSPYEAPSLPDGAHTFEVRATDGVGNLDASPASRSFTVGTTAEPVVTPPETTLPEAPPAEAVPVLEPEVFPSPQIAPTPVAFSFEGIKHGEQGRTTKLTVSVPGPGTLVLFGRKVSKVTRTTATGGSVSVPVEPKPRFRNGALRPGRTRVYVTYTPLGGTPVTRALSLRLS